MCYLTDRTQGKNYYTINVYEKRRAAPRRSCHRIGRYHVRRPVIGCTCVKCENALSRFWCILQHAGLAQTRHLLGNRTYCAFKTRVIMELQVMSFSLYIASSSSSSSSSLFIQAPFWWTTGPWDHLPLLAHTDLHTLGSTGSLLSSVWLISLYLHFYMWCLFTLIFSVLLLIILHGLPSSRLPRWRGVRVAILYMQNRGRDCSSWESNPSSVVLPKVSSTLFFFIEKHLFLNMASFSSLDVRVEVQKILFTVQFVKATEGMGLWFWAI